MSPTRINTDATAELRALARHTAPILRSLAVLAYPKRNDKAPPEYDEIFILAEDLENAAEAAR